MIFAIVALIISIYALYRSGKGHDERILRFISIVMALIIISKFNSDPSSWNPISMENVLAILGVFILIINFACFICDCKETQASRARRKSHARNSFLKESKLK